MPDCDHCDGTGVDPEDESNTKPCPECEGTGFIEDEDYADTGFDEDEPS
jgi:DnaJ-class molecular chaperone